MGEQGLDRIIFTALSETDDLEIKRALQRLYKNYHERVQSEVSMYHARNDAAESSEDAATAWALLSLVSFMNIVVDLELIGDRERRELFTTISNRLLGGLP